MSVLDFENIFPDYYKVNKTISKEKWIQNSKYNIAQEKVFLKQFESSKILYSIPMKDTELQVIEVMLKYPSAYQSDFARLIHPNIPYPVLLIQNHRDKVIKISTVVAHKNSQKINREVIDNHIATPWIDMKTVLKLFLSISNLVLNFEDERPALESKLYDLIESFDNEQGFLRHLFLDSLRTDANTIEDYIDDFQILIKKESTSVDMLVNIRKQLCTLNDDFEIMGLEDILDDFDVMLNGFSEEDDVACVQALYEELCEMLSMIPSASKTLECFEYVVGNLKIR